MTTLLDMAIEASRELPAELQDELARIMLTFVNDGQDVYQLTPEEEASLQTSLDQARRGEYAPTQRVEAILARLSK